MANGIRTGDPRGINKRRSSKFCEGYRVRQTPEEGRRTYRPERCGNNNKDEDNIRKSLMIKIVLICFYSICQILILVNEWTQFIPWKNQVNDRILLFKWKTKSLNDLICQFLMGHPVQIFVKWLFNFWDLKFPLFKYLPISLSRNWDWY